MWLANFAYLKREGLHVMRPFYKVESTLSLAGPAWICISLVLFAIEFVNPNALDVLNCIGWITALLFPIFFASIVVGAIGARKLESHDYMFCPFCRYDIAAIAPSPQQRGMQFNCPECGSTLTRENTERLWRSGHVGSSD